MSMAQFLYQPREEDLTFSVQYKRETPSFQRTIRHGSHQGGIGRRASCISSTDQDGKARNSTRRRTHLACNRCRKRKIKCSGETPDRQACSNCRSSGNADCQFVRVNSSVLETKVCGYPYSVSNPTLSPNRIGTNVAKHASLANHSVREASLSRAANYGGLFDQHERPAYSADQDVCYEEEPAYHQGYIMPCDGLDYPGAWNQKTWNAKQSEAMLSDQVENILTQSAYPYIITSGVSTEPSSAVVPTMTLPSEVSPTDRVLPNPAICQAPRNMTIGQSTVDPASAAPFAHDFRFLNPWAQQVSVSNSRVLTSMPNEAFTVPMAQTKLKLPTSAQDMTLEYPLMGSATMADPRINEASGMESEIVNSADRQLSRNCLRDHGRLLGPEDCSLDVYGYSTTEKSRSKAVESSSSLTTLLNGLQYSRVRYPEPNGAFPFRLSPADHVPEYRPPAGVQAVTPLGSNGF